MKKNKPRQEFVSVGKEFCIGEDRESATPKDEPPTPVYLIASDNDSIDSLEVKVTIFLERGYKLVGGVATYFNSRDGRQVFLQSMHKEDIIMRNKE